MLSKLLMVMFLHVFTKDLIEKKYVKILWGLCATHCINLLRDIGNLSLYKDIIEREKNITNIHTAIVGCWTT